MDLAVFDEARKLFKSCGGRVNGLEVEYEVFLRACEKYHKKPDEQVLLIAPAIEKENKWRQVRIIKKEFCPEWKNFKTWLRNACWTQELPEPVKAERICGWCGRPIVEGQQYGLVDKRYPVHKIDCLEKAQRYYTINRKLP